MANDKKDVRCSFCGRMQDEVKRLIAGPNAYICNECVNICAELIEEEMENAENTERFALEGDLPTPAEMKAALDQYVIGQDLMCSTLISWMRSSGSRPPIPWS